MNHHISPLAHRQACIVDGDNLTRGGQLSLPDVIRIVDRLAQLTAGLQVTFALQECLAAPYMPAYIGRGWGIRFAPMTPDAADVELLVAAADYVTHDVTRFVVVSGDFVFADLARRAELHVVSHRESLSRRLRLAATTVTYLDDLLIPEAA